VELPKEALQWTNEAITGEMCLIMGQSTGGRLFGMVPNIGGVRR